ncbi:DEAD/DEAH box helicase [Oceanisphaera ostreae]|uniref:SNF2-related protein n=1 Tax=Oceanisphaera ostreae TaxID=914151 RepID=A0ABW3KGK5_9GAMM
MHFTLDDIQQMTSPAAFKRGQIYFHQHKVMYTKLDEVHKQIIAEVQGNEPHPYEVFLFWEGQSLISDCSCPVGYNCKHGVATALQWLRARPADKEVSQDQANCSLSQWLTQLSTEVEHHQPETVLEPGRHYMLYQLESHQGQHRLVLYKAYLKKNSEWSQRKPYAAPYYATWNLPDFYLPQDSSIMQQMQLPGLQSVHELPLTGPVGAQILDQLLLSQRLILADDRTLQAGQRHTLHWEWQASGTAQRLTSKLEGLTHWEPIAVTPPYYLDRDNATIGEIATPLAGSQLAHLYTMPPVPNEQMAVTAAHLRQVFTPKQLPLAQEPELFRETTPIPHLTLAIEQGTNGHSLFGMRLHFDYGPIAVPCNGSLLPNVPPRPLSLLQEHNGHTYQIERNAPAEYGYALQLHKLEFWPSTVLEDIDPSHFWTADTHDPAQSMQQWQQFTKQELPELERKGWRISEAPDYQFEIHDARFDIELQDQHNSWFDFSLGLQLGDIKLDTMEVIGAWLQADMPAELLLPIGDDWLRVDTQPLWAIRDLLMELFDQKLLGQAVTLPAFQAAQFQHLELDDRQAPLTRAMMAQLQDFTGLQPVPVPAGLRAELRPYQQQGLDWLVFLHRYGFGGILADDMGLGKTLQALALLQHLKETNQLQQPAMILAPTSLVGNWQHEAARFTPDLKVLVIHGPQRHAAFEQINDHDLVITTYPLLLRDHEHYAQHHFSVLVLDEAQAIKNPTTKVAQQVRELKGGLHLCLSGTPLENHLGELWSLMDFVLPGLLGGRSRFNHSYRQPIENDGNRQRQQELGQRLAPFMLRRTKAEVATELPKKTEITQYVELQGKQRALYESIRVSMEKRLRTLVAQKGMARSHIEFLDALLKLRQACIDPRLVKLEKAANIKEHAKLDWLADAIPRMIEEGRHLLVFSQFTEVLGLIEADLKQQNIAYSKLTGKTRKRQEAIDRFQQGEVRVFLISLKAGGSGLNLTAADVVIHVDPWWNPAVENQATDRAHRIGQDKPVFVYKLVAADTVEERIQQMQQQKQALADALFSDAGSAGLPADSDSLLALLS